MKIYYSIGSEEVWFQNSLLSITGKFANFIIFLLQVWHSIYQCMTNASLKNSKDILPQFTVPMYITFCSEAKCRNSLYSGGMVN